MGLRFSKPRTDPTPHEMLGICELCTLEETKRAYYKAFYQNKGDQEKMRELNKAYSFCRSNLDVDLYHELFHEVYSTAGKAPAKRSARVFRKDGRLLIECKGCMPFDFNAVSSDFFERLSICFELKCTPKFFDPDFVGFYNFWARFSHVDKALEGKVRRIIKIIRNNDPRMSLNSKGCQEAVSCTGSRHAATHRSFQPKQEKTWKMYCDACKKGFNSENTLKDHLNSKQHKSNIASPEKDSSNDVVLNARNSFATPQKPLNVNNIRTVTSAEATGERLHSTEKDSAVDKPEPPKGEHPLLRTCHACKKVLRSRGELVMHLRTEHPT